MNFQADFFSTTGRVRVETHADQRRGYGNISSFFFQSQHWCHCVCPPLDLENLCPEIRPRRCVICVWRLIRYVVSTTQRGVQCISSVVDSVRLYYPCRARSPEPTCQRSAPRTDHGLPKSPCSLCVPSLEPPP